MINVDIGSLVSGIGDIADDLFTSDEERLKIALQGRELEASLVKGQQEVNKVEAQHKSVFVAGWRPFVGWVGGIAVAYQFILYPLLLWIWQLLEAQGVIPSIAEPPPIVDSGELWVLISGMLGIAGMRSFDKKQKTQTDRI